MSARRALSEIRAVVVLRLRVKAFFSLAATEALRVVTRLLLRLMNLPGWSHSDLTRVGSIVIVRLDAIGDAILTVPLIREVKQAAPQARITLVVPPAAAELFEPCPYVDEVIAFSGRARGFVGSVTFGWRALKLARVRLWPRRFDLALLPRWDVDAFGATWLAYLSGAACRVGFSERVSEDKARYNRGCDRMLTIAVDDRSTMHDAVRPLALLQAIGGRASSDDLELWIPHEVEQSAARALAEVGHGNELLIAIAPGAGHPRRMWPVERFVDLASRLRADLGARIVVVGSPTERELGVHFERALGDGALSLIGKASLLLSAAFIKRCAVLVCNDSAPLHVASALGTPVVEISSHSALGGVNHSMSPTRFGPWGVPSIVLQPARPTAPCDRACYSIGAHCILSISVDEVEAAVHSLLERGPHAARGFGRDRLLSNHPGATLDSGADGTTDLLVGDGLGPGGRRGA